jgi:hypothetical protein
MEKVKNAEFPKMVPFLQLVDLMMTAMVGGDSAGMFAGWKIQPSQHKSDQARLLTSVTLFLFLFFFFIVRYHETLQS